MTRKEAAQRIATLLQANNIYPELEEAVHIAIEALEQEEPFMNKPCVANQVCHEDKVKTLKKIRTEIEALNPVDDGAIIYRVEKE